MHPFAGHFRNHRHSQACDGSSKVIIDAIMSLQKQNKIRAACITLVFVEIFENSLFADIAQYLKQHVEQLSDLRLNVHVYHASVKCFFGLKDDAESTYASLMKRLGCRHVFWFLDPYKLEVLLSPKRLHLCRILRADRETVTHFVFFLLDLK